VIKVTNSKLKRFSDHPTQTSKTFKIPVPSHIDAFVPSSLFSIPQKPQSLEKNLQQTPLYQTFKKALLHYHRLDGLKDGSPLQGIQHPPIPMVKQGDINSLKEFIENLSAYLASQPDIAFKAPSNNENLTVFRQKIADSARENVQKNARLEFEKTIESIHDAQLRAFVKRAVEHAPPEFFVAPSSSSGNYHPADEMNPGGLLVHTVRDVKMGRILARYFNLSQKETDEISAALLLHDIQKGGIPWRGKAPNFGYDPSHGPIAAQWLKQFKDQNSPEEEAVDDEVRNHMAQWNKPLPTPPKTLGEQIVSYADYLASLENVYVNW
jgi:hypothetical protein